MPQPPVDPLLSRLNDEHIDLSTASDMETQLMTPEGQDDKERQAEMQRRETLRLARLIQLPQQLNQQNNQHLLLAQILTDPHQTPGPEKLTSHGLLLPISQHPSQAEAEKRAQKLIQKTGVDAFRICQLGQWHQLTEQAPHTQTKQLKPEGQELEDVEDLMLDRQLQELELQEKIRQRREARLVKSLTPGSLEYHGNTWRQLIQTQVRLDNLWKQQVQLEARWTQLAATLDAAGSLEEKFAPQSEMVFETITGDKFEKETCLKCYAELKSQLFSPESIPVSE